MSNNEIFNLAATIIGPLIGILGAAFAIIKIFFRYKSRILFITNCQILHRTIWDDLIKYYKENTSIKIEKKGPHDHALRPLVLLPEYFKKYIDIPNQGKVILECINQHSENSLKIIAEVYWIPSGVVKGNKDLEYMLPWTHIKHPVFSLILRRYFGMERPMYQDNLSKKKNEVDEKKWDIVWHSTEHLDKLNDLDPKKPGLMKWAISTDFTHRYFNPYIGEEGHYEGIPNKENFIEYCGISISLRKRSWMHIERE